MNAPHDIDRELAAWLLDGPSRSPERPIEAALAHAQTHPRRRYPLAFPRKDPMSSHPSTATFRPLALVAVLGLLLVAALAVGAVGGLFERRPAVVPPSMASPSSSTPSTAPSSTPAASVGVSDVHVDLIEHVGADASVDITDLSGTLVSATSGDPADGASVPEGGVVGSTLDGKPNVLVLTWSGSPCDTTHRLTISADGQTFSFERPACSGDAIGVDHVLQLTFDHPVDVTKVKAPLIVTGG
jgi:hypothetical protein